jgi:type I restriction enzyme R subunit
VPLAVAGDPSISDQELVRLYLATEDLQARKRAEDNGIAEVIEWGRAQPRSQLAAKLGYDLSNLGKLLAIKIKPRQVLEPLLELRRLHERGLPDWLKSTIPPENSKNRISSEDMSRVTNEAFARVKIDQLLRDIDWRLTDERSVRFEYPLDDGGKADYALFDRQGRALAVLEAKSTSVNLSAGEAQGRRYADQLKVPFVFLSNGEEVWFCDKEQDAHFREVDTVFSQDDLVRRRAARGIRRNPLDIPIDHRIAGGGGRNYQTACIDILCREMVNGRRRMLVEMATGTGKTRTAAALLKRLFEASWVTRALFVVDRNQLAIQAEDAFAECLPNLPCYRVPRIGRRFQDEKRITIVTLQTLINEYANYSAGYFDLIVIDESHRSIYGQWRRALDHFDAIKIGLTATPCVMQDAPDIDEEDRRAIRDTLRFFEVQRPTYSYSLAEAIDDGHLVPYEIYRAMTTRTAAVGGFPVAHAEIDWAALEEPARTELEALFANGDPLIVDPTALERKFTIPERNRAMAREFREVLENGYTGPNGIRRAPD